MVVLDFRCRGYSKLDRKALTEAWKKEKMVVAQERISQFSLHRNKGAAIKAPHPIIYAPLAGPLFTRQQTSYQRRLTSAPDPKEKFAVPKQVEHW
jgi:hypothetical protein